MINCEVELILIYSKNCVLADMTARTAQGANPEIAVPSGARFKTKVTKLYVPVVTLSEANDIKLLQKLKIIFKRA